jgi:hypothetical protein
MLQEALPAGNTSWKGAAPLLHRVIIAPVREAELGQP